MMKRMVALLVALLGALIFTVPAFARTGETVTLTFRLAVEGDVPGWQHFAVEYYPAGGQPGRVPLCTTAADEGVAGPRCVGGKSYAASVEVPAGNPVTFRFLRHDTRTAPEYFKEATRSYSTDALASASYIFPGTSPVDDTPAHDQYASDDGIPATPVATPSAAPLATGSVVEDSASDEVITEDTPITPAVRSTPSASAGPTGATIEMLPDTGGINALPVLGLVLVILGAGSVFRKVL